MKKAILYSILILSISLIASCNKGDNNDPDTDYAELVKGQWERTALTIDGGASQSNCATDFKVTLGPDGYYGESPLTGNTCTSTGNTGTYTISDAELVIQTAFFHGLFK